MKVGEILHPVYVFSSVVSGPSELGQRELAKHIVGFLDSSMAMVEPMTRVAPAVATITKLPES